jgi:hypothetical protein
VVRHYVTTTHARIVFNYLGRLDVCEFFFGTRVFCYAAKPTVNVTSGPCVNVKKAARVLLAGL